MLFKNGFLGRITCKKYLGDIFVEDWIRLGNKSL